MKLGLHHLIAILLVMAVVVLLLPHFKTKETYVDVDNPYGIQLDDYSNVNRKQYIELGKRKYNRFADNQDMLSPGLRTADDPGTQLQLSEIDYGVKNTMNSIDLLPTNKTATMLGVKPIPSRDALGAPSAVLKEAQKCEANKTRQSCSILGKPEAKLCGVCIKEGTDAFGNSPNKHIGGMLILPPDREAAQQLADEQGTMPQYQPSVGSCPPGFFFVDKDECIKQANRLDCKESGLTGGFKGKTVEGRHVAETSCVNCLAKGETTFLYEPKHRSYAVQLRFLTPTGTGITIVRIFNKDGKLMGEKRLLPGVHDILVLSGLQSVKEADTLRFFIYQKYPHRPRGRDEVFLVTDESPGGGFNTTSAAKECMWLNTKPATEAQLNQTTAIGAQNCVVGHGSGITGNPMQVQKDGCGQKGWNKKTQELAGAWCYGVKPPVGVSASAYFNTKIHPFFDTSMKIPEQDTLPTTQSAFGDAYEAPYYRGILIQWESVNTVMPRRANFEGTITKVNGQSPSNVSNTGINTFRVLRRLGTFGASEMIKTPKAAQFENKNESIASNSFWLWSNQREKIVLELEAQVPGILADTFYTEDMAICPSGPLIGVPESATFYKPPPCSINGQEPGKYDIQCIVSLFRNAGGDPDAGTLSPLVNPDNMNTILFRVENDSRIPRTEDEIIYFFEEYYKIALTGKDTSGNLVGLNNQQRRSIINDAAMKMFGFELVSPCDDIEEDNFGNIMVRPKIGPFQSDCLDFLFLNAGKDGDRQDTFDPNSNEIYATYSSLADRYSGLKRSELATKDMKDAYPLQACQRVGSAAPISHTGAINESAVRLANSRGIYVEEVQRFYDGIHKAANKSFSSNYITSKDESDKQADAMMQCYGVQKMDDVSNPTKCGVMARYVRILRSTQMGAMNIAIASVKVFSSKDNVTDYAMGKPTTASPVWAGNKDNLVKGRTEPTGNLDLAYISADVPYVNGKRNFDAERNQFWMVDLGNDIEVRKVYIANFANWNIGDEKRPIRSGGLIIQLLDGNQKVIIQKSIMTDNIYEPRQNGLRAEIIFHAMEIDSPLPLGMLVSGKHIQIETSALQGTFIAPAVSSSDRTNNARAEIITLSMAFSENFNFDKAKTILRLANGNTPNSFRILSVLSYPNMPFRDSLSCLTFQNDGTVKFEPTVDGKTDYKSEWFIRKSILNAPGYVSIQNAGSPGLFLSFDQSNKLIVEKVSSSSPLQTIVRASWRVHNPS